MCGVCGDDREIFKGSLHDYLLNGESAREKLSRAALEALLCDSHSTCGVTLGSRSTIRTFLPRIPREAAMLTQEVVFPTPPFWLAKDMIFPIYTSFLLPYGAATPNFDR